MSDKTAYIVVSDDGTPCTQFYDVQYKISVYDWSKASVISPAPISPLPSISIGSPATMQPCITIDTLESGQTYDIRIRRMCCNGAFSDYETITLTI